MATIQGVYVALFGRPADPTGLAFFNGVTKNGADLTGIGDLTSTDEYKQRFAGMNNSQIVNSIFQSLFNRDSEPAGLSFFVNALTAGTLNIKNIAIAILDGAQGSDKTIVTNKIAAADAFTNALDTSVEIAAYSGTSAAAAGIAFLKNVTTTVPPIASVDTAISAIVPVTGTGGNTISLLADNQSGTGEILSPTSGIGTPPLTTTARNDTINAGLNLWNPKFDKIDGGAGINTLNAMISGYTSNGSTGSGDLGVNGLANINILKISTATTFSTLNLAEAKQLTQVWHVGAADSRDLTLTGLDFSTAIGLTGNLGLRITLPKFKDTSSASDTATLLLDNATATRGINFEGVETVNITNTGSSNLTLGMLKVTGQATQAMVVNIAGDGVLLFDEGKSSFIEKVDASAFSGNFTIDQPSNGTIKSIIGGKGSDTLKVFANLGGDMSVAGGAGADTLSVTETNGSQSNTSVTLSGGADADTFLLGGGAVLRNIVSNSNATEIQKGLVTITDFDKTKDVLKVNASARDTLSTTELNNASTQSNLFAALQKVAGFTALNAASVFNFGGDAYIFVNNNTAALDTDGLVKIVGASVTDFTSANLQIV